MNWRRACIGAVVAVLITLLLAYGLTVDPGRLPEPIPGTPAPAFDLADMRSGERVRLEDLRGEVVVINFWASWCGPCEIEHPVLQFIAGRYGSRVRFYGISHRDTREDAEKFLRRVGEFGYPTLMDPGQRTAIQYGLTGVPETFVIGRDGIVAHMREGPFLEPDTLILWLDRILAEDALPGEGRASDS